MALITFVILIFLIFWFVKYWKDSVKGYPPGPVPWPILGNLPSMDPKAPHESINDWSKIYGPIYTVWLPKPNIIITDIQLIRDALVKQGDAFSGRFAYQVHHDAKSDEGILMNEGEKWKTLRRYTLTVLRDLDFGKNGMEPKVMVEANNLVKMYEREINPETGEGVIDPAIPLHLCVGNIIQNLVMGSTFKEGDSEFHFLKTTMDDNFKSALSPGIYIADQYPWIMNIPIPGHFGVDRFVSNMKKCQNFFGKQVDRHKKVFMEGGHMDDYAGIYLREMERRQKMGESLQGMSEWQLTSVIGDLWAAGMETTVTTLKWAMLFMMTHQHVQQRVQEEIDRIVPGDTPIKMSHKNQMPYTSATLIELQRRANIIPINLQHKTTRDVVVGGYLIKRDSIVIPQISAVHMNPELFPDPKSFNPSRFLDESGQILSSKADLVIPFSLGKRECLGSSLARMELFLMFVTLIRAFEFEVPRGTPTPPLEGDFGATIPPHPYKCLIRKRNKVF